MLYPKAHVKQTKGSQILRVRESTGQVDVNVPQLKGCNASASPQERFLYDLCRSSCANLSLTDALDRSISTRLPGEEESRPCILYEVGQSSPES